MSKEKTKDNSEKHTQAKGSAVGGEVHQIAGGGKTRIRPENFADHYKQA